MRVIKHVELILENKILQTVKLSVGRQKYFVEHLLSGNQSVQVKDKISCYSLYRAEKNFYDIINELEEYILENPEYKLKNLI